jgi:hypothetical protein
LPRDDGSAVIELESEDFGPVPLEERWIQCLFADGGLAEIELEVHRLTQPASADELKHVTMRRRERRTGFETDFEQPAVEDGEIVTVSK